MEAIYNEFKSFTAKTDEQFTKVDSRLTAREATDATILQRMTTNQAETLTSMKSQFEGMMAQVMQQLASPTIDPSPSSRRSHSTSRSRNPASPHLLPQFHTPVLPPTSNLLHLKAAALCPLHLAAPLRAHFPTPSKEISLSPQRYEPYVVRLRQLRLRFIGSW